MMQKTLFWIVDSNFEEVKVLLFIYTYFNFFSWLYTTKLL